MLQLPREEQFKNNNTGHDIIDIKISLWLCLSQWVFGAILIFFAQGQDLHPIKIYHLVVCLPYFLKFFVEPFLRNRIFKISTLNPRFSTLKHKNPLKSTIFIHFGLAVWQILTIFHQKKDSESILTIFFLENWQKIDLKVKYLDFNFFLIFKIFFKFSQLIMEFQLQINGPSEPAF